eukprot:355326-Chlamydomonas_euryale.AAC.2
MVRGRPGRVVWDGARRVMERCRVPMARERPWEGGLGWGAVSSTAAPVACPAVRTPSPGGHHWLDQRAVPSVAAHPAAPWPPCTGRACDAGGARHDGGGVRVPRQVCGAAGPGGRLRQLQHGDAAGGVQVGRAQVWSRGTAVGKRMGLDGRHAGAAALRALAGGCAGCDIPMLCGSGAGGALVGVPRRVFSGTLAAGMTDLPFGRCSPISRPCLALVSPRPALMPHISSLCVCAHPERLSPECRLRLLSPFFPPLA